MSTYARFRGAARAAGAAARVNQTLAQRLRLALNAQVGRNGMLGPGSSAPYGGRAGYFDYRGLAHPRTVAAPGPMDLFDLGNLVYPASGRRSHTVSLDATVVRQHVLLLGPSQAGKTTSILVPWISAALKASYSVVAADVKGSMFDEVAAAYRRLGGPPVRAASWDYRRRRDSISWNFLSELHDDRRVEAAAVALVGRERPGDPQPYFWQRDTRLVSGLLELGHAATAADGRRLSPGALSLVAADQQELRTLTARFGAGQALAKLKEALDADPAEYARIMSGVLNALTPIAGRQMLDVTRADELRLDDALAGPGLLGFGMPMGEGRLGEVSGALLLNLLMQRLHGRHGHPAWPVMMVLDEAARLVDKLDFEELLSTAAAANVTIVLALQDLGQLPDQRIRDGVLANCQTVICMGGVSHVTAEELSKRFGQRPELEVSIQDGRGCVRTRRHVMMPVLGTREIMELPFGRFSAITHSRPFHPQPFITDLSRQI